MDGNWEKTIVKVGLILKGKRDDALTEVTRRIETKLQEWFVEDVGKGLPYPPGSLLWYAIKVVDENTGAQIGHLGCSDCQPLGPGEVYDINSLKNGG